MSRTHRMAGGRAISLVALALMPFAPSYPEPAASAKWGTPSQQALRSLDSELDRIKADTALVAPPEAQFHDFRWSPKSDYLAFVLDNGNWHTVDLSHVHLLRTTWRHENLPIGVIDSKESLTQVDEKAVAAWAKIGVRAPRKVVTRSGVKIELPQHGLSTALVVTKPGHKPQVIWHTGMENCHSLVLSADENYVAFVSELNGLIVMRVPKAR